MADEKRSEEISQALAEILRRQEDFEQRLRRLEGIGPGTLGVLPHASAVPTRSQPNVEARVGLTVVNRVGVVTLILGVAFFFKWAVDNNWIGPGTRVILGLIAGCCALAIGEWLWRKAQQVFAQGITGTGIAIVYLALYAAYEFYALLPQTAAFLLLALATALAFTLAVRYNSEAVAALGLLGGYLTPLLLTGRADHPWFLLSVVLLMDGAALALANRRAWRALDVLAVIATVIIYFGWWFTAGEHDGSTVPSVIFVLAYFAVFVFSGSRAVPAIATFAAALEVLAVWHAHAGTALLLEVSIAVSGAYHFSRSHIAAEYLGAQFALLCGLIVEVLDWASRSSSPANRLSVETVAVSVLTAGYALALVGIGVARRAALDRLTGLSLIALVIAKLYIFDVWQLARLYRIGAFVALGVLLITTSFLYSRFRSAIEALLKDEPAG